MFAIVLTVVAIVVIQKVGSVERFYFIFYEYVWGSLFAFIGILVALSIWQITKRTKPSVPMKSETVA